MVKYAVLGSGSSANSYIFEYDGFSFVVDNGFSAKEFLRRAETLEFDPGRIGFILVTHVHGDHIGGVDVLSRKLKIPVVRHESLPLSSYLKGEPDGELKVRPGETYNSRGLTFVPFLTSHDAPHSMSYHFVLGGTTFTIITDTGGITREMYDCALRSDVLFLETNYNREMLENGPYPYPLKKRILSARGHLSNGNSIAFLNALSSDPASRVRLVYFCHMSDTNNTPERLAQDLSIAGRFDGTCVVCRKHAMQSGLDPTAYPVFRPIERGPGTGSGVKKEGAQMELIAAEENPDFQIGSPEPFSFLD